MNWQERIAIDPLIFLLRRILPFIATTPLLGRLWIVEPGGLRVRGGQE